MADDESHDPCSDSLQMEADDPIAATSSPTSEDEDIFFDALDYLPPPLPPLLPSPSVLRRRRPRRAKTLEHSDPVTYPSFSRSTFPSPSESASAVSTLTEVDEPVIGKDDSSEATSAPRTHTPSDDEAVEEKDAEAESAVRDHTPTPGILEFLAVLVIKAVEFQVSALISCLAFPVRLLGWWFMFVTDPLGLVVRARSWALAAVAHASGALSTLLGRGEGMGRVAGRMAWGLLWAAYVCAVLCALLTMAFIGGGLLVGRVVEEPVRVTENLNFDYTRPSPVAFVPVRRMVPPKQRLHLEVSLVLPESDYNRRLGVFQVRAEFLSVDGKVTSSSSQPCMLKFKSAHIHFMETFLQSVSLLSGYSSESQVIKLKMSGMSAFEPTTAVRILLKQRAEFSPGGGIPEIYAGSLKIEAELPLLKRILWKWRWTLFVWNSMLFFFFELVFAVVFCRPCTFPSMSA